MSRFLLLIALAALAALGGCATTSSDYYRDGRYYYGDAGRQDDRYYDDYSNRYYNGSYVGGDYYHGDYYGGGYTPDYLMWPTYYSIFWPINHWYVDPYYYPGYYYGVTYFPRDYWSLSLTWGNSYRYGYGYAYRGYWDYSPYRYSWADNYYDWYPWYGQHSHHREHYDDRPRYGSARNEAERVLALRNRERGQAGNAAYRSSASQSALSSPDRRGPRAAYYPPGQSSNAASSRRGVSSNGSQRARDELIGNARYRSTAMPAGNVSADRYPTGSLESAGSGVRSTAKPAASVHNDPTTRLEAVRDARSYRGSSSSGYVAPLRAPGSSSIRSNSPSERSSSRIQSTPIESRRLPTTRISPKPSSRESSYPSTSSRPGQVPAARASSYSRSPRDLAPLGASRPTTPVTTTPAYSPPLRSSRPVVVPNSPSNSYRAAPPAVYSAPVPSSSSAGSSRSGSDKSSSPSNSSRSRSARGARYPRSGDDD